MSIKEEFENAWQKALYTEIPHSNNYEEEMRNNVLWAAKWMAERCAVFMTDKFSHPFIGHPERKYVADTLRKLAKELQ